MNRFSEEIKKDLYNYLEIHNSNKQDIQNAIKYLEENHYNKINNWHEDNYFNNCNYGLLFALCGFNFNKQVETGGMFKNFYNVIVF